jgi:hypothetical protein
MSLIYVYVGGILAKVLDAKSAGTLGVATVAQAVVWPAYAVKVLYEVAAPATVAVVGYIVALLNSLRSK